MGQASKKQSQKPEDQDMDSSHWFYTSRKSKEKPVKEDSTFKNCPTCQKTTTHVEQNGKLICTGCNQPNVAEDDSKKAEKIEEPTNKDRASMGQVFSERAMGILHQYTEDPSADEMVKQEFSSAKAFMEAAEEHFYNVYGVIDEMNWDAFKARMKEEFKITD